MERDAEIGHSDSGSLSSLILALPFGIGPQLYQSGETLAFTDILAIFEWGLGDSEPLFGFLCQQGERSPRTGASRAAQRDLDRIQSKGPEAYCVPSAT